MKTLATISLLLFTCLGFSQRVVINGEIKVPVGEDPQGISVVNTTAMRATISNEAGLFQITAAEGDTLQFSALQFQDFSVIVDEGVINTRRLNVFVSEAVTELPEVVVTPYDLSGNVRVDVQIIPTEELDLPTKSAAEVNPYEYEFRPDSLVSPPNAAMRSSMIYNGANFANIFRHIVSPRGVITNVDRDERLEEKLLELRSDDFYEEQLNIDDDQLKEFIYFAADNGLTKDMLKPKNEMQLIEFLVARSVEFNQMKAGE
ncbi:hypothetical protein SAMN04488034_11235 [Salinimicrobium catena]|uniref:Carboxypeptidase-like regulatory domain-containing protein n=1 Tax=Salinimicrobium catena TaxID=390640 RepID=A0A1H5PCX2_9FLAO|nr:hypothetical protein [Salinimicrobium catena]SDL79738.1 hypothetical protein SAMN04488140_11235 [Salinimicrobium catena]SEF11782.1 hypothetical protein SAMN04488034_11235 [Salinimicrobium catena]